MMRLKLACQGEHVGLLVLVPARWPIRPYRNCGRRREWSFYDV